MDHSAPSNLEPRTSNLEPRTSNLEPRTSNLEPRLLPALRRYAKHAWLLHGYLISCLILLPVYRSPSYSQDSGDAAYLDTPDIGADTSTQTLDSSATATPTWEPPPDPSTMDSDGDLVSDIIENSIGSSIYNPDTDYDGITDADEINITGTNPTLPDSNWNGISDYNEFYGNYTVTADYNSGVDTTDPSQTTTQEYFTAPSPVDYDQDGIEDHLDPDPYSANNIPDQDGDYVPDNEDSDPSSSWLWNDWNRNGTNDDAEYVAPDPTPTTTETYTPPENPDHDTDGIANETDSHPWDSLLYNDWNFNGSNDQDEDWDGDGVANLQDSHPNSNILWCDWNQNQVNDDAEAALNDSDGDSFLDYEDSHPNNADRWSDWNEDGTNDDATTEPAESSDPSDPSDPTTHDTDTDTDGIFDLYDSHPQDMLRWDDWDDNGLNDHTEATQDVDTDGDGHLDSSDSHPQDNTIWNDWNGDGQDDNLVSPQPDESQIPDSDVDGYKDHIDTDPQNAQLWNDQNRNGQNDHDEVIITDNDLDGYANEVDTHPDNQSLWNDHNNDSINDEMQAPPDSDGDGITDDVDSYPYDFDNDGITDLDELNAGTNPGTIDTDGDGLSDPEEAYVGTNPSQVDTDNDGLTDTEEVQAYNTDPLATTTIVPTNQEANQINQAAGGQVINTLPGAAPSPSPESEPEEATTVPGSAPPGDPPKFTAESFKWRFVAFRNVAGSVKDSDDDGIPDVVEDLYAPLMDKEDPLDAAGDLNSNGTSNVDEFEKGADLLTGSWTANPLDFDGDGMTNVSEDANIGLNAVSDLPTAAGAMVGLKRRVPDAFGDPDGDGLTNREEVNGKWHLHSTSPRVGKSSYLFKLASSSPLKRTSHWTASFLYMEILYKDLVDKIPDDYQMRMAALAAHNEFGANPSAWAKRLLEAFRLGINARTAAQANAFITFYQTKLDDNSRFLFRSFIIGRTFTPSPAIDGDVDGDLLPSTWEDAHGLSYLDSRDAGPMDRVIAPFSYTTPPPPGAPPAKPPIGATPATLTTYEAKLRAYQIRANTYNDAKTRALIDPDGDRVSNLLEFKHGTNPTVRDYAIPYATQPIVDANFDIAAHITRGGGNNATQTFLIRPAVAAVSGGTGSAPGGSNFKDSLELAASVYPIDPKWQFLVSTPKLLFIQITARATDGKNLWINGGRVSNFSMRSGTSRKLTIKAPHHFDDRPVDYYLDVEAGLNSRNKISLQLGPYRVYKPGTNPNPNPDDEFNNPSKDYASWMHLQETAPRLSGGSYDFQSQTYLSFSRSSWRRENGGMFSEGWDVLDSEGVKAFVYGQVPSPGVGSLYPTPDEAKANHGIMTFEPSASVSQGTSADGRLYLPQGNHSLVWPVCPAFRWDNTMPRYLKSRWLVLYSKTDSILPAIENKVIGSVEFTIDCSLGPIEDANSPTGKIWVGSHVDLKIPGPDGGSAVSVSGNKLSLNPNLPPTPPQPNTTISERVRLLPVEFKKMWETKNKANQIVVKAKRDDPKDDKQTADADGNLYGTPRYLLYVTADPSDSKYHVSLDCELGGQRDQFVAAAYNGGSKISGTDKAFPAAADQPADMLIPATGSDQSGQDFVIKLAFDANKNGLIDASEPLIDLTAAKSETGSPAPPMIRGFSMAAVDAAKSTIHGQATGSGFTGWKPNFLGEWFVPNAQALERLFYDGATGGMVQDYQPTTTLGAASLNAFGPPGDFNEWLTHHAGCNFNADGVTTVQHYYWNPSKRISNLIANSSPLSLLKSNSTITSQMTSVTDATVENFKQSSVPVGQSQTFPSGAAGYDLQPVLAGLGAPHSSPAWVPKQTLLVGDQDGYAGAIPDDAFGTVGRSRFIGGEYRFIVKKEARVEHFSTGDPGGYDIPYTAVVVYLRVSGSSQDLYDFNHNSKGLSIPAAITQLSYGNGGYGRTNGIIFRATVDILKDYEVKEIRLP